MIFKKHTKQILQQTIPYMGKKYGHRLIKYEVSKYGKGFNASASCEFCEIKLMAYSSVAADDSFVDVYLQRDYANSVGAILRESQIIGYVDSIGNDVLMERKEISKSLLCNKYKNLD